MKRQANKYKPWPKRRDKEKGRPIVDRDKLKQQYLSQPYYVWKDFCNAFGYKPDKDSSKEFPIKSWQQEWVETRCEDQDNSAIHRAVNLRETLTMRRLDYIEFWNGQYDALNFLTQATIAAYSHTFQEAVARNNGNLARALIEVKRTHKHWAHDIEAINSASHKLQKVQLTGLLMSQKDAEQLAMKIRQRSAEEREIEADGESIKSMPIAITQADGTLISPEKVMPLMSKWYDQLQSATPTEEEEPNSDFTPPSDLSQDQETTTEEPSDQDEDEDDFTGAPMISGGYDD